MSKEKIGLSIFAGLLGLTGLVSSGAVIDVNPMLERFKGSASEQQQQMSISAPEIAQPAITAREPVEKSETTTEVAVATPETVTPRSPAAVLDFAKVMEPTNPAAPEPAAAPIDVPAKAQTEEQTSALALPPAEPQASVTQIVPSFDILRVEPDGSTLVAGKTTPLSEVELVTGSQILTKTKANDRGEFVAILDQPLKKGDYQIVLRATSPDGAAMTSAETAIVSIPETGSGDVLALVEAPGAPSRLITVPKAEPALVQVEPPVDGKKVAVETPVAAVEKQPESTVTEMAKAEPAEPAKSSMRASAEVAPTKLRIEAVEIDGSTVFVAGSADVGARIRVYANDILLGENIANAEGRFLVEVNRNLPVGDYVIRADRIGSNAVDVLSRVSVPFTRSEGEKLAAVAPQITVPVAPRLPNTPPVISAEQSVITTDTQAAQRLEPVDQSVIIRRGDTLWQISRRVYGRGVKYTTIYAANQKQIEDPNRIWPGQVFSLPEPTPSANQ